MTLKLILTVYAVCMAETNLTNVTNADDGGSPSYGICQIKIDTAKDMDNFATVARLMEPEYNMFIATKYYQFQLKRYKGDERCAISAYNAGRCIDGNQKKYVDKVLKIRAKVVK